MTKGLHTASLIQMLLIAAVAVTPAFGQGGRGGRGMMGDGAHAADMQVFHQLFDHRTEITRRVLTREDGIETVTESMNPEMTRLLQMHVASMLARVKEQRPIHQRDATTLPGRPASSTCLEPSSPRKRFRKTRPCCRRLSRPGPS